MRRSPPALNAVEPGLNVQVTGKQQILRFPFETKQVRSCLVYSETRGFPKMEKSIPQASEVFRLSQGQARESIEQQRYRAGLDANLRTISRSPSRRRCIRCSQLPMNLRQWRS